MSQRVQIRQKILDLLLMQHPAISRHLAPSKADDLADPVVIRRQTALGQVLPLEYALQRRPLLAPGGIWFMALIAMFVIDLPSRGLLFVEPELGVGLAAFH